MKKVLTGILCCICLLGMTGCENNSKALITDNDGNEVEMTSKELVKVFEENEKKFEKTYYKAKIDITEEYDSVSEHGLVTCLKFKNNFVIAYHNTSGKFIDFVSELNKGDKIHFTGTIYDVNGYCGGGTGIAGSLVELSVKDDSIFEIVK